MTHKRICLSLSPLVVKIAQPKGHSASAISVRYEEDLCWANCMEALYDARACVCVCGWVCVCVCARVWVCVERWKRITFKYT